MKMKVLAFCPEAGVAPFYLAMEMVAHSLYARGHDVYFASCQNSFSRCVVKLSITKELSERDHDLVCGNCKSNMKRMGEPFQFNRIMLSNYEEAGLDEKISDMIASWDGDIVDFEYDGEKLGRISQFDLCLGWKIISRDGMTPKIISHYKDILHTVVKTYIMSKKLIEEKAIERVFVFNQYGPNMAVYRAAIRCGALPKIMSISSHAGVDRRYIWFTNNGPRHFYMTLARQWDKISRIPMPAGAIERVSEDIESRFTSNSVHVYSPNKDFAISDIREKIGLRTDRRTIVVFTSSPDEIKAQEAADDGLRLSIPVPDFIFPDQIAWLADIKRLASLRDDLQFCIRIHPREAANRRDSIYSEHLTYIQDVLSGLPENIVVIWPQDSTSSYDLLDAADMVMTSWSTMGLESARLGIPVLSVFQRIVGCPVGDFIRVPETPSEYYRMIDEMIDRPTNLFDVRQAFRWYVVCRFSPSVPVVDAFPTKDTSGPVRVKVLNEVATIERILELEESEDQRRIAASLQGVGSEQQWNDEANLVKAVLGKALVYFMTGNWPKNGVTLHRGREAVADSAVLDVRDGLCTLRYDGQSVHKHSRLVQRLGDLLIPAPA